jgi:peptidoglycan/LPS O-acetylase OafA/YrhL
MTLAATKTPSKPDVKAIPSLDGIRAISFMLVFLSHAGLGHIVPGGLGVTIFFFLSGFLITTLLRSEYEGTGTVNLGHFYLRRALRILPPFYLILAAAAFLTAAIEPDALDPRAIAAQALHLSNYWTILFTNVGIPIGTGVYWSLAVEEHFYLVFPLLFLTVQRYRARNQAAVLLSICLAVLIWRLLLVFVYASPTDRTYLATDTRIDSILFGCVLAVCGNPVLDESSWRRTSTVAAATLLSLSGLVLSLVVRDNHFRESLRYTLQGISLMPLFAVAIRHHRSWVVAWLNWQPVQLLGRLSFVLYLCHVIVIELAERYLPGVMPARRNAVALVVSVAIAMTVRELVERPCARLSARFRARDPRPASMA